MIAVAPRLLGIRRAMSFQVTICRPAAFEGIGLHSGNFCRIAIAPASPNTGIVFKVAGHRTEIQALPANVVDSHHATTLGINGTRVQTVEHLMAAAAGLGLDNLEVRVEGTEVPAADGSAEPFVALLREAGRAAQAARRQPLCVTRPIRVGTGSRWLQVVPSDTLRISYTLDSPHPAVGTQAISCEPTEALFSEELARARTYGFLRDVDSLRKNGLARGGSLDNAIVIGKRSVLNGLRYPDEFVRHKILDLIGDLALLGRPILGHVIGRNAGHALNHELVVAIERAAAEERRAATAMRELIPRPPDLTTAPGFAAL
jgi:UDP-3-O-[3-hydroxymyristoyl] N-acetylglucosamine deacetylase